MPNYQPLPTELIEQYNAVRQERNRHLLCHAPVKSMRFAHSGNALVCCYNREVRLGKYPEVSVHDMWFSDKRQQIIDLIAHNDLSMGCQDCMRTIEKHGFHAAGSKKYDYLPNMSGDYPLMLDFEISNTCNLECVMCTGEFSSSIRKNREKKPPYISPYDLAFAQQLEEFIPHLWQAKFAGGEPFLIELHYEIWNRIVQMKPEVEISIQTNGTVLNNKVRDLLAQGNFVINVSIDALDPTNYESIRVNADHSKVMQNIGQFNEYAQSHGKKLEFDVCFMRNNWQEIPTFIKYCNERDIELNFHIVKWPVNFSLQTLPADELAKIHESLSAHTFPASDDPTQQANINYFHSLLKQVEGWHRIAKEKESSSNNQPSNGHASFHERFDLLKSNIKNHVNTNQELSIEARAQKSDYYIIRLNEILAEVEENDKIKAVNGLLDLPVNMVTAEIDLSDNEHILSRIAALLQ